MGFQFDSAFRREREYGSLTAAHRKPRIVPVEAGRDEVDRRRTQESGHEPAYGALEEIQGPALLLNHAIAQQHDSIGEGHRLDLVVSDVDHRLAEFLVEALDFGAHLVAELGVEVGERLVEEEQACVANDGAANCHPLALPTGELARQAVQQGFDAEHRGGAVHPRLDLVGRRAPCLQSERDVLAHVQVGVERVVLEHHGEVAVARTHLVHHVVTDGNGAGVHLLQPRDAAEQRRLAAARRADEDRELTFGDIEVDAAHGLDVAVGLFDAVQAESCHESQPLTAPSEMPRTR